MDWGVLVGLCIVGFALGKAQNAGRDEGHVDFVSHWIQSVTSPIAGLSGNVASSTGDFFFGMTRARRLAVENQRLYDRLAATSLYTEQSTRLQREIDSLRQLLALPDYPGKTKVAANIIGFFPRDNRLTLSVGSRDGIRRGLPVVSSAGLVGTIQTVSESQSQVLLLTTPSLKIGAIVLNRNPSPIGIAAGENATTLSLPFSDPKAPVQIGDIVATSGMSENIPRGIPMGRVIQVDDNEAFGQRVALIDPFVSVGELREVVVLK